MKPLTPKDKLKLAAKISQMMDDYFADKDCFPDEEVLLLALHARTDVNNRLHLLAVGGN